LPPDVDPRVTRLGKVLRKLSLDELPQLFNVLRGQMTLVGPRPVVPDELAKYEEYTHFYVDVKPGMTGAWQTGGRSHVDYPERAQIDANYVAGWTFWLDIKILLLTVPAVLRRHGAH
jgi:undecaprenyl-phosphate galactose phosphotransferase